MLTKLGLLFLCILSYTSTLQSDYDKRKFDKKQVRLKINEIIEFENYYLLNCGRKDEIYRVIVDKVLDTKLQFRIGQFLKFNLIDLKPDKVAPLLQYSCKCDSLGEDITEGNYYRIKEDSIILPQFMGIGNVYYGISVTNIR